MPGSRIGDLMLRFERMKLSGWRQFSTVEIVFDEQLTILTGSNGAGKTTLLNLLIQHFGIQKPYLGTPTRKDGVTYFTSNVFSFASRLLKWFEAQNDPNTASVGSISYSNGGATPLLVPKAGSQSYNAALPQAQPVLGFHMPSHRAMPNYQQVPTVAFGGIDPEQAFDRLYPEVSSFYVGSHTGNSTIFRLKELLANWASYGESNSRLSGNESQKVAFDGFVELLKIILPHDLGFEELEVIPPDVVLKTTTGDFLIDSLSGGLLALVEMAALIYTRQLRTDGKHGFVVTMDEPENHLHPAMQRAVLPSLMKAFPQVQFIVATHSPFVVASYANASVYALKYENVSIVPDADTDNQQDGLRERKVQSVRLDFKLGLTNTNDVLRDVLGVSVTYPLWVEDKLTELVEKYKLRDFNKETLESFKADLADYGLAETLPGALIMLGKAHD